MIQYTGFADLINKINQELGGFCKDFNYKRKDLASLGKAASLSELFGSSSDETRNWAINYGGGTEVQYHMGIDGDLYYGIGFNFQYVPFKNDNTPEGYMAPYVEAFFTPSVQELVQDMKTKGYGFVIGNEESLKNKQYKAGDYYLFGKQIKLIDNAINDDAYLLMLEDMKTDMYKLYEAIFIGKNNITTKEEYLKEYTSSVLEIYSSLLYANKNLVLTGAPGTGKTYLAKQIAAKIILDKDIFNITSNNDSQELSDEEKKTLDEQCGFVQFHPSYDYTDFMEGIKPNDNGKFDLKKGVFKKFCAKAANNIIDSKKSPDILNKTDIIKKYLYEFVQNVSNDINNNSFYGIKDKKGNDVLPIISITQDEEYIQITDKNRSIKKHLMHYIEGYVIYSDIQKNGEIESLGFMDIVQRFHIKVGEHTTYYGFIKAFYDLYHNEINKEISISNNKTVKQLPFVFIIDEINRGDINKIFGELFYSIDPGYRGEAHRVETQYQEWEDSGDIFSKGFYVPENVYIIGTMNDIDRSVESMDFAMRRRFVWKEVLAENTAVMLNKLSHALSSEDIVEKARKTMLRLNKIIETIEGLNSSYHIGPAYFLKLKYYLDRENMFDLLWQNHIQPLLSEYLRGYEDYDKIMARLLQVYQCSEDIDNNSNN